MLAMKIDQGEPTRVHVTHAGKNYVLTLAVHVFGVEAVPNATDMNGLPQFNVTASPVMAVAEAKG